MAAGAGQVGASVVTRGAAKAVAWPLAFVGLAVLVAPLVAVLSFAGADTQGLWSHLAATVLPAYVVNTLLLCAGVVALALVIGVGTAWLVTMHDFPARRFFELALVLPLAMPAYILAYAWTDLLQVTGPVQQALRDMAGWGVRDYWFPEIRSLGGAVFVLGLALCPYVYLVARAAFRTQSASAMEAARTLGLAPRAAFLRVGLPMARPAIAAAATLVAMETLADFGAVKYFDLEVFTTGIYRAWFATGNPAAAAQLAALLLAFVFACLLLEPAGPRAGHATAGEGVPRPPRRMRLAGATALAAVLACGLPILFGFAVPALALALMALGAGAEIDTQRLLALASTTFGLAGAAAVLVVAAAALMSVAMGRRASPARDVLRASHLGYATPGIVVGVGLLVVAGALDALVRTVTAQAGAPHPGLVLSGSLAVLLYAYLVRFFAVAHGPVDAAWLQMGTRYADPARTLGSSPGGIFRRVDLPLMRGTLATALALVFVDVVKELPATMILRPFNLETLSTEAFRLATTERLDLAAVPSLAIAAAGLLPVFILMGTLARDGTGPARALPGGSP